MRTFKTQIEECTDKEFDFECYENTEPIEIGDKFLFFFVGIASVQECCSEKEKYEINPNDRIRDDKNLETLDLVTGFWKNCFKIKTTNFDLSLIF